MGQIPEPRSNLVPLHRATARGRSRGRRPPTAPCQPYDWAREDDRTAATSAVGWSLVLEGLARLQIAAADEVATDLRRQLGVPTPTTPAPIS